MTGMLASVNCVADALLVLAAKVDIIDLKQPSRGALGALDIGLVGEIVKEINGRAPISATIGDLPMQAELVSDAVLAMAKTGVDYIKIGFFPGGDSLETITKLSTLSGQVALIAVLFADLAPDLALLPMLKDAGFKGVMLDTADKGKGSLTKVLDAVEIGQFVLEAKKRQLLCGLAGSLRQQDVTNLLPFQPDYLGFRGALCEGHERQGKLSKPAILELKRIIATYPN